MPDQWVVVATGLDRQAATTFQSLVKETYPLAKALFNFQGHSLKSLTTRALRLYTERSPTQA